MKIAADTIQEIKERANLLQIVGEITPVRRQGGSYVCLCPFHTEHTPSFHIRENTFHCFGCGEGGDVITFIMKSRGLSFFEAVSDLAGRCGISLRNDAPSVTESASIRPKLYDLTGIAQQFFREALTRALQADQRVADYVTSRELTPESISTFGIGFAPPGNLLLRFMRALGVNEEHLLSAGLVKRSASGELYDTFQSRLQFPIFIDHRRIAGFGGRIIPALITDPQRTPPKYLNSGESPIYKKSTILFGAPQAMPAIRTHGEVYLVEGYMDVVGLAQAGVPHAIASCGTALADTHIRRIAHMTKRAIILFDGDRAGRAAAARAFELFLNTPIDIAALFLPPEEDPDSFARRHRSNTLEQLRALPRRQLIDVYLDSLIEKYCGTEPPGAASKAAIAEEAATLISRVTNAIARAELTQHAARRLGVRMDLLPERPRLSPTKEDRDPPEPAPEAPEMNAPPLHMLDPLDREILSCVMAFKEDLPGQLLADPTLCAALHEALLRFADALHNVMSIRSTSDEEKREQIAALLRGFGPTWVEHWRKTYRLMNERDVDLRRTFEECCVQVRRRQVRRLLAEIDRQIREEIDTDRVEMLLREKVSLSQRLSTVR